MTMMISSKMIGINVPAVALVIDDVDLEAGSFGASAGFLFSGISSGATPATSLSNKVVKDLAQHACSYTHSHIHNRTIHS